MVEKLEIFGHFLKQNKKGKNKLEKKNLTKD